MNLSTGLFTEGYQVKQTGEKGSSRFTQRWQILHIPLFLYKHPDVTKWISKNYFKKSLMDDDYKFLTCWILTQFRADAFASLVIVVSYWSNLFSCVCLSHLVRCVHLCATSLYLQMDWTTLRHSHNIQEIKVCEWRVVRLLLPDFFVPSFYCVVLKNEAGRTALICAHLWHKLTFTLLQLKWKTVAGFLRPGNRP